MSSELVKRERIIAYSRALEKNLANYLGNGSKSGPERPETPRNAFREADDGAKYAPCHSRLANAPAQMEAFLSF